MMGRNLLVGAALVWATVPAQASLIPTDAEIYSDWEVANCDPDITDEQEDFNAWPDPIIRCGGAPGRVISEFSGDGVRCIRYTTEYGYRETCWEEPDQAMRDGGQSGSDDKEGTSTPMLQLSPAQRQRLLEQTQQRIKVETLKPRIPQAPTGSDEKKD